MSDLEFLISKREEILRDYLPSLIELEIEQEFEQNKIPRALPDYYYLRFNIPAEDFKEEYYLLAFLKNELIGRGRINWRVKYEDQHIAFFTIYVRKPYRRKGFGSIILKKLIDLVPPQVEILGADAYKNTPGIHFLKQLNAKIVLIDIVSVAEIRKLNKEKVLQEAQKQLEKTRDKGYEIVYIYNGEFEPFFDISKYILMIDRVVNDIPIENRSLDTLKYSYERLREDIKYFLKFKSTSHLFPARHIETGDPVGLTFGVLNPYYPEVCYQDLTGVMYEHRGNGLGLAIKYQLLAKLLEDTEITLWATQNASTNKHLLRINEILGHKLWTEFDNFEIKKEDWMKLKD